MTNPGKRRKRKKRPRAGDAEADTAASGGDADDVLQAYQRGEFKPVTNQKRAKREAVQTAKRFRKSPEGHSLRQSIKTE